MSLAFSVRTLNIAYGAIIALAFCTGIDVTPCFEDADPMGVVELGTFDSQPSSCCERLAPSSVYHDPACEGSRIAEAMESEAPVSRENGRTGE